MVHAFLKDIWYKDAFQINPIGKNDLVIYTGKSPANPFGVILEVKSVLNKTEMISAQKPNAKDKLPPELNKEEYIILKLSQQDKLFRIE